MTASPTAVLRAWARRAGRARLVALAVVVLGVGTVAAAGLPAPADVRIAPTVPRDVGAWTMPLDGYVSPSSILTEYATDLLVQQCLAGKPGDDYVVPWRDVDAASRAFDAWDADRGGNDAPPLTSTRPLDPATASTRGYHGPNQVDAGRTAWQIWSPHVVTADIDACTGPANRALDVDLGRQQIASGVALHLTLVAAERARRDPAVLATARTWHTCMVDGGASIVTDVPAGMTAAVRSRFDLSDPSSSITTEETTLARLDAHCQQTSGYRRALYDDEWDRLLHVTAADAASLRTGSRDMAAVTARARHIVDTFAPPAP